MLVVISYGLKGQAVGEPLGIGPDGISGAMSYERETNDDVADRG
jgi:hypothetical protein